MFCGSPLLISRLKMWCLSSYASEWNIWTFSISSVWSPIPRVHLGWATTLACTLNKISNCKKKIIEFSFHWILPISVELSYFKNHSSTSVVLSNFDLNFPSSFILTSPLNIFQLLLFSNFPFQLCKTPSLVWLCFKS